MLKSIFTRAEDAYDEEDDVKRMILIGLAGFLLFAPAAAAQEPGTPGKDTSRAMAGHPMTGPMMMSMMDSADARLARLVSTMNQATGGKKIDAMAAVINELVAQRTMMRRHARQMMMMMGRDSAGPAWRRQR